MNDLIKQVEQWGVDKGIIGGKGTLLGQVTKTQEEAQETRDTIVALNALREAFYAENPMAHMCAEIGRLQFKLRDDIGDTLVTCILNARIANSDAEECLQVAYDEIKGRTGKMSEDGTFVKDKEVAV